MGGVVIQHLHREVANSVFQFTFDIDPDHSLHARWSNNNGEPKFFANCGMDLGKGK